LRRWSPTKLQFCCEHAHRGCGPVTTTQRSYNCHSEYTDCWDCLLKRWSTGKIAWCCQHENIGCAPVEQPRQPPTQPPATAGTHMKDSQDNAGKIAGGVLGGMAGAAALGLLGATVAEEQHIRKEHIEQQHREVVHSRDHSAFNSRNVTDALLTAAPQQAGSKGSSKGSSGIPWWWWLLPLLLLPLLGLCFALYSFFHKSEGKKHKTKRTSLDDAECSSELPILETESTCTSLGQYMSPQSSFSQASINQGFEQRVFPPAAVATITPPKIRALLTPPRFVGYATPSQQLSPASSFAMEGASTAVSVAGTGSSVLASPATVVVRSGTVTPPTPGVLVAASPTQHTQLVEVGIPTGIVVRQR